MNNPEGSLNPRALLCQAEPSHGSPVALAVRYARFPFRCGVFRGVFSGMLRRCCLLFFCLLLRPARASAEESVALPLTARNYGPGWRSIGNCASGSPKRPMPNRPPPATVFRGQRGADGLAGHGNAGDLAGGRAIPTRRRSTIPALGAWISPRPQPDPQPGCACGCSPIPTCGFPGWWWGSAMAAAASNWSNWSAIPGLPCGPAVRTDYLSSTYSGLQISVGRFEREVLPPCSPDKARYAVIDEAQPAA